MYCKVEQVDAVAADNDDVGNDYVAWRDVVVTCLDLRSLITWSCQEKLSANIKSSFVSSSHRNCGTPGISKAGEMRGLALLFLLALAAVQAAPCTQVRAISRHPTLLLFFSRCWTTRAQALSGRAREALQSSFMSRMQQ